MPSSLHLQLPLHVRSDHLAKVAGKCLGLPWEKRVFDSDRHRGVDFTLPSSHANPWHVHLLVKPEDLSINVADFTRDLSFAFVHVVDLAGGVHDWAYVPECEHEDYKLFCPDSCAVSLAVARRLLRFFGGELKYRDGNENFDETKKPSRACYPPKPRTSSCTITSDDRYFQFQNALHGVSSLTPEEIQEAAELSSYGLTERCQKLLDRLIVEQSSLRLDRETPSDFATSPRQGLRSRL